MTIEQNLGKRVTLMVVKEVEFGVYLGTDDDKVLLPGKQVPEGIEIDASNATLPVSEMPISLPFAWPTRMPSAKKIIWRGARTERIGT